MNLQERLQEIRGRCERARKEEWKETKLGMQVRWGITISKADFLAHSIDDVPVLVEAVKHLIDTLFEFKTCPNCYACEENIERRYKIISKIEKIFEGAKNGNND